MRIHHEGNPQSVAKSVGNPLLLRHKTGSWRIARASKLKCWQNMCVHLYHVVLLSLPPLHWFIPLCMSSRLSCVSYTFPSSLLLFPYWFLAPLLSYFFWFLPSYFMFSSRPLSPFLVIIGTSVLLYIPISSFDLCAVSIQTASGLWWWLDRWGQDLFSSALKNLYLFTFHVSVKSMVLFLCFISITWWEINSRHNLAQS
jgi:hypothetical protein